MREWVNAVLGVVSGVSLLVGLVSHFVSSSAYFGLLVVSAMAGFVAGVAALVLARKKSGAERVLWLGVLGVGGLLTINSVLRVAMGVSLERLF